MQLNDFIYHVCLYVSVFLYPRVYCLHMNTLIFYAKILKCKCSYDSRCIPDQNRKSGRTKGKRKRKTRNETKRNILTVFHCD